MIDQAERESCRTAAGNQFRLLSVDDDADDTFLLRRALASVAFSGAADFVVDGQQAMEWLEENPAPDLILLDLKMPRRNGFELLQWMRTHERCRAVPVAIFTTSSHNDDIARAYELGADLFLVKPLGYAELLEVARAVHGTAAGGDRSFPLLRQTAAFRSLR